MKCKHMREDLGLWQSFNAQFSGATQTVVAHGLAVFTKGGACPVEMVWHLDGGVARVFRMVLQRRGEMLVIPPPSVPSRPLIDPPSIPSKESGIKHA